MLPTASAVVVLSMLVERISGAHAGGGRKHDGCGQPGPVWAAEAPLVGDMVEHARAKKCADARFFAPGRS